MLGHALGVGAGRVDDLDAAGGRGFDVDLIVADAVPAHDLELVSAIEQGRVDDPAGTDDERIGTDDLALQSRRIEGARHPQLGRVLARFAGRLGAWSSTKVGSGDLSSGGSLFGLRETRLDRGIIQ